MATMEYFPQIIGHNDIKERIKSILTMRLDHYEEYMAFKKKTGSKNSKHILFYGLGGVGKSTFLESIHSELSIDERVSCKLYKQHDFMSHQSGISASLIYDIFQSARKSNKKLSVILLDEVDALVLNRSDRVLARERTTAFLTELAGTDDNRNVLVMATTNKLEDIDKNVLQRFEPLKCNLPTFEDRVRLAERFIGGIDFDFHIDYESIAKYTEGFSGRNFEAISDIFMEGKLTGKKYTLIELLNEIQKYQSQAKQRLGGMTPQEAREEGLSF